MKYSSKQESRVQYRSGHAGVLEITLPYRLQIKQRTWSSELLIRLFCCERHIFLSDSISLEQRRVSIKDTPVVV